MTTVSTSLPIIYNLMPIAAYVSAAIYAAILLLKQQTLQQHRLLLLIAIAIGIHGISLYFVLIKPTGIDLTISNAASLVAFSINMIVLTSSCKKPLHNLFILLLPLTIATLCLSLTSSSASSEVSLTIGVGLHVVLSIIAYSLLLIAVLQALLLYWQDNQLKKRHFSRILSHFPPLQTMETLMFEVLWIGVITLSAGIIVGVLYIDDIFAQHLVHKTLLSIAAWFIFSILLFGRMRWGWRSNQAIRWVLVGFCFLMLAYFGSKVALEMMLIN